MYADLANPLRHFLPGLRAIVSNTGDAWQHGQQARCVDRCGVLMPPCIVTEKGESLDTWLQSSSGKVPPAKGIKVRTACPPLPSPLTLGSSLPVPPAATCVRINGWGAAIGVTHAVHYRPPPPSPAPDHVLSHAAQCQPRCARCVQVLSQIAATLHSLHDAGYVHRDVRPANIIWMPLEHRWALIGFERVARIDDVTPPAQRLPYAPPEVLHAAQSGARSMVAAPSLDAWALGLVAIEVLAGQGSMLTMLEGATKVRVAPCVMDMGCCRWLCWLCSEAEHVREH